MSTGEAPPLVLAGVDDLTARRQFGLGGHPVHAALDGRPPGATIFLSHTPWRAERAAALGAGLMLSGHTHDGQIWPFRYFVKRMYPYLGGLYRVDGMPLIVCRGPIRKEAMDVFEEMGISRYGILLSEKDSIVYPNALSPELRKLTDTRRVHRVPDYTGASKEERVERMNQIVQIAKDNGYDSVFAGYGFMAEDEEFVATIERAGLKFIGPNSSVQARAGKKDEAKRTALQVGVSVTPGINNVTARTLVKKYPTRDQLLALVKTGQDADALGPEYVEEARRYEEERARAAGQEIHPVMIATLQPDRDLMMTLEPR